MQRPITCHGSNSVNQAFQLTFLLSAGVRVSACTGCLPNQHFVYNPIQPRLKSSLIGDSSTIPSIRCICGATLSGMASSPPAHNPHPAQGTEGWGLPRLVKSFFTQIPEEEGVNCDRLRFLADAPSEAVYRTNLAIANVVLDTSPETKLRQLAKFFGNRWYASQRKWAS